MWVRSGVKFPKLLKLNNKIRESGGDEVRRNKIADLRKPTNPLLLLA